MAINRGAGASVRPGPLDARPRVQGGLRHQPQPLSHDAAALDHARRLMARGTPLAGAAAEAGFTDQSHFSRQFKRAYGADPGPVGSSSETAAPFLNTAFCCAPLNDQFRGRRSVVFAPVDGRPRTLACECQDFGHTLPYSEIARLSCCVTPSHNDVLSLAPTHSRPRRPMRQQRFPAPCLARRSRTPTPGGRRVRPRSPGADG